MKNKGFTLIEIVVVIAIIAVMAGIFTVNMSNILQSVNKSEKERLSSDLELAADAYIYSTKQSFNDCIWIEIRTLIDSGFLKKSNGDYREDGSIKVCKDGNGVLSFQ